MNLNNIKKITTINFSYKESLIFYFSLLTLFLFPLINNDLPYRDDQVRILRGNDWAFMGRNMADIVMHILTFSYDKLSNISPLTFILSITVLSFTFSKFIHLSMIKKDLVNHFSLSFIVLSPFYLQNFSYQYDNLTMSLGVCFSLLAFMLNWNKKMNFFYSILLLTGSVFFFQPVSNIFVILVISNLFIPLKEPKERSKTIIQAVFIYFIAVNIYYFLFKHYFELTTSNRATLVSLSNLPDTFINAFDILMKFLKPFILSPVSVFIFVPVLLFVISLVISIIKTKEHLLLKLLKILSPIFFILFIWGPFIMLDETFARPREFVALGAILCIIFISNNENLKNTKNINLFITIGFALYCISLCYQYANLAKQEYSYNQMLTEWISKDINSNKLLYSKKLVYLNSHPDYAPGSKIILDNQPFLQYIQMPYYNWFSRFYLENRGVMNIYKDITNIDDKYDWNSICKNKDAKLIVENKYYNIYLITNALLKKEQQEHVSVWFKRSEDICSDRPNINFMRNLFFIEKSNLN